MSEWSKEHDWKSCVGVTLPWVQIPLSPPNGPEKLDFIRFFGTSAYQGYITYIRATTRKTTKCYPCFPIFNATRKENDYAENV